MAERRFILEIKDGVHERTVQSIGRKLLALNSSEVHSGARAMESVLHDLLQGIRDKVLLSTPLAPAALESLLKKELGSEYKQCRLEWLAAG
ncbi:MAG: hypothetical protein AB7O26_00585 [Planctomycetaceae bacterium]